LSIDFLFFQAEDGIRDRNVTGVQTCALPIYRSHNKNLCQRKIYSMSSCERTSSFCPLSSFSFLESCPWCIRVRVAEGRLITNELVDYKRNGRKRNESILKA